MNHQFNMPASMSRLHVEALVLYLEERGWRQVQSRFADRLHYEGEIHTGGEPYQLSLPTSPTVPKYRTLLQRVIYKLSGIEDREPSEIIRDIMTSAQTQSTTGSADTREQGERSERCVRIRNAGDRLLRIQLDSRPQEYQLYPRESIELQCREQPKGTLEIEYGNELIHIRD